MLLFSVYFLFFSNGLKTQIDTIDGTFISADGLSSLIHTDWIVSAMHIELVGRFVEWKTILLIFGDNNNTARHGTRTQSAIKCEQEKKTTITTTA